MTDLSGSLRGLLPGVAPADGQRLPAALSGKLPLDTVRAGGVPAGVHLALVGSATAVRLRVKVGIATAVPAPTLTSDFVVWHSGEIAARIACPDADGSIDIALPQRNSAGLLQIYLPETPLVVVQDLEAVGGTLAPAPRGPRWVVYGDSISQGWSVSDTGRAWPSVAGRALGLDLINLGFAGSARGELMAAVAVSESNADLVTLAWGTNAWSSVPTDAPSICEAMRLFLTTVRQGLPDVPVLVVSPIFRPAAEDTANRFGATLIDLRVALEEAVRQFGAADPKVMLLSGRDLVPADQLVDGVHPGDAGHRALAAAVQSQLTPVL